MSGIPNANAVERALAILESLDSSRRGLNISELSRKLDIPKSSAHVIILTLERLGYVQKRKDSLNYSLGLRAYGFGLGMMKNLSISEVALPHMRVLVDEIRLPAHLAIPDGDQGVYIQKVDAPGLIKIDTYVGRRMDLHCTGVGKICLPMGRRTCSNELCAKQTYIRHTRNTITSPRQLMREVRRSEIWVMPSTMKKRNSRYDASPCRSPSDRTICRSSLRSGHDGADSAGLVESMAERLKHTAKAISAACPGRGWLLSPSRASVRLSGRRSYAFAFLNCLTI